MQSIWRDRERDSKCENVRWGGGGGLECRGERVCKRKDKASIWTMHVHMYMHMQNNMSITSLENQTIPFCSTGCIASPARTSSAAEGSCWFSRLVNDCKYKILLCDLTRLSAHCHIYIHSYTNTNKLLWHILASTHFTCLILHLWMTRQYTRSIKSEHPTQL